MPARHAIAAAALVATAVAFVQPAAPRRAVTLRKADHDEVDLGRGRGEAGRTYLGPHSD